jgi:ubiquinone/menaquinone biosynthesis C-methylase UbiE
VNTPFDFDEITKKIQNNLYKGSAKKLLKQAHKDLTRFGNKKIKSNNFRPNNVLEIGAGSGELFEHVDRNFQKYYMTDLSDWGKEEILALGSRDSRIYFELQNVENLSYDKNYFDRVLVSCVIAHVTEPFKALEELRRVTNIDGIISIFVSTDPGLLLKIIRAIFTKKRMTNLSIPYELCNVILHRNNPTAVLEMVKWIFQKDYVKVQYFPFKIKSWNLSTHIIINIIKKTN